MSVPSGKQNYFPDKQTFNVSSISTQCVPLSQMVVSSAYMSVSASSSDNGRSFTYTVNSRGPRIEPCGTPISIFNGVDKQPEKAHI